MSLSHDWPQLHFTQPTSICTGQVAIEAIYFCLKQIKRVNAVLACLQGLNMHVPAIVLLFEILSFQRITVM